MDIETEYLNEAEHRLEKEIERMKALLGACKSPNIDYATKFIDYLSINKKPQTIARRCRELRRVLLLLGVKDAKSLTRSDIEQLERGINSMKQLDYDGRVTKTETAEISKNKMKLTLKVFVKWLYTGSISSRVPYPEIVRDIEIKVSANKKLPEDMLTEAEVLKLIGACNNARDKAMISLLYDAGLRAGEFLRLRMKSVILGDEISYVMVDYRGKTGARRVPIVFSVPFISNYINTYRLNAKPDDPFFVILMNNVPTDRPMNYDAFRILLRKLCNRTGIKKRIHPHLFRHSRATHMANTLTEQQLKMLFGWAGDSKMASVYVHLSGRDLDDAVLRANGLVSVNKEPEKPLLTLKRCLKCHSNNEATNKFCKNCGSPLDVSTKEQIERLENVDSMKDRMQRLERALDGIYQLLDAKIKKEIEG